MHKFNPAHHQRLTSKERYELMPPQIAIGEIKKIVDILSNSGQKEVNIADIGCGSGFFTIPLIKTIADIKNIDVKVDDDSIKIMLKSNSKDADFSLEIQSAIDKKNFLEFITKKEVTVK